MFLFFFLNIVSRRRRDREEREKRMAEELAAQETKLAAIREQRTVEKQKRAEDVASSADQTLKAGFPCTPL